MGQVQESRRLYTITELADERGDPSGHPFLREQGVARAAARRRGNRIYTHRNRVRLLLILRGKRLGFSLAGIKQYLDLYDADPTHRRQLVHLLRGARQRIDELESQRRDLELTLEELRDIETQVLAAMQEAGIDPPPWEGEPEHER